MSVFFSSDFHLGHKVIVPKYRKQFNSQEEHDELLLDKIAKLKKREILYILGDFIFDSSKYDYYIKQLNKTCCRIKLVLGNHDSLKLYKEDRFEIQLPLFSYKNNWVSHCPIHPQEMRGRDCNIHGHLHGNVVEKEIFNGYFKDERIYKGLRKAIENETNIKFPNTIASIYDYYLYIKIKKASKIYFRIILSENIFINTNNLSFFEYCSKKFNVDIIIPK